MISRWSIFAVLLGLVSCGPVAILDEPVQTVSMMPAPEEWNAWANWVEARKPVSDGEGHGPDIGSDEWAMALDRQLAITVGGHGPDLKSSEWRNAVEAKIAAGATSPR